MKKALNALTALVSLGALSLGSAGSASAASLVLPRSLSGLSASQIATLSIRSAVAKGTCTNDSKGTAVGFTFGSSTNSGTHQAQQTVFFNKSQGQVLLLNGALYMKESAALLTVQFGKADPRFTNRWILITATNKSYHSVSSGLLFSSMITQVRPAGTLHASKVGILSGVKVVALSGKANSELGLTGGVETLFVEATAPYLPVKLVAGGRSQGVPTSLSVTFSNWGHQFRFTAPQGALSVPSSALP